MKEVWKVILITIKFGEFLLSLMNFAGKQTLARAVGIQKEKLG